MQTSPDAGLAEPEPGSRLADGIARGALIVAGLTIFSRILGLVRTLVFSQTVGASCLGTAYVTANQVPDLAVPADPGRRADQRDDPGAGSLGRASGP